LSDTPAVVAAILAAAPERVREPKR
jgi:hypothetical protein